MRTIFFRRHQLRYSAIVLAVVGCLNLNAQDTTSVELRIKSIEQTLSDQSETFNTTGNIDLGVIEEALDQSKSLNFLRGNRDATFLLYQFYKKSGDFQKASESYQRYLDYKDELFTENLDLIREGFYSKYDSENKEDEINLLRSRNEIEALKLTRKRWVLLITLSGVFFLVVLIFLVFRRYRTRQKSKILVSAQNEKFNEVNQDLLRINKELEKSEHDQRRLNQTKDRFFSLISEELRTPLNSLSELLKVLISDAHSFSKAEVHELAVKINDSVNSLLELIENLLQWSRIQIDQISFSPEEVLLNDLIKENMQLLNLQADSKKVSLMLDEMPEVKVEGDKNMIHFIIRNLILNNIKFSPEEGEIKIYHSESGAMENLFFELDSPVKEYEQIKELWKTRTNIEETLIKDEKTRLGLMLTRYFVQKNEGKLTIEQSGQSTKFSLSLPKS